MISSFPVKQLIFNMNSKQIVAMSRSSSRQPRIYPDRSDASDDPPPSPSLFLPSPPKNGRQLHLASILLSLLHSILTQSLHIWKLTRFASGIATILTKLHLYINSSFSNLCCFIFTFTLTVQSIAIILKMAEKLCLQWNDFKDNVNSAFVNLRDDRDFSDVTLACEDGQQVEAHKVILAASSPFFQKLLRQNKHPHPLIYMRGIKSENLSAIVDFLYYGEANVFQENLDSFLAIAEELQLRGLMGRSDTDQRVNPDTDIKPPSKESESLPRIAAKHNVTKKRPTSQIIEADQTVALPSWVGLEGLEERVISMMEKSRQHFDNGKQPAYICKVCGKEARIKDMKDHIEANHLEGLAIPCNFCEKTFRSRDSLRKHMRKHKVDL